MPTFIVNRNAQPTGENEVHQLNASCPKLPHPENRIDLGTHNHCSDAVAKAKRLYPEASIDGCYHCCNPCHNR